MARRGSESEAREQPGAASASGAALGSRESTAGGEGGATDEGIGECAGRRRERASIKNCGAGRRAGEEEPMAVCPLERAAKVSPAAEPTKGPSGPRTPPPPQPKASRQVPPPH